MLFSTNRYISQTTEDYTLDRITGSAAAGDEKYDILSRFDIVPACDGQTDGQTVGFGIAQSHSAALLCSHATKSQRCMSLVVETPSACTALHA